MTILRHWLIRLSAIAVLPLAFTTPVPADIVLHQITSDAADGEARQTTAGAYSITNGSPVTHIRVGFQNGFGSEGQAFGGLNVVWYFKLPQLNSAAGEKLESADFVTTLLDENATAYVTPRFNADLYALGFTATPGPQADEIHFFAGPDQTGPGLGTNQTIQKMDDDFFTVFTDWQDVNTPSPKLPKPVSTDAAGRTNLLNYIKSIYANPAFPNTGNEFLVLRLSADHAASEQYEENGSQQFYGKGTTRYRVATSESATLTSSGTIDYSNVVPTRLTLGINSPAPAALFQITRVQYQPATSQISLTWPSTPGKSYTVSSSSDLAAFTSVNASVPAAAEGSETTYTFIYNSPQSSSRAFFRVTINP